MSDSKSRLEALCADRGLKMTEQRRVIARVGYIPQPGEGFLLADGTAVAIVEASGGGSSACKSIATPA